MSIYNQACTYQSDCENTKSLVCNDGTINCTCPTASSSGLCDCVRSFNNEYYWDGTTCQQAKAYLQSCTANDMCKLITQNTICSSSICTCPQYQYLYTLNSTCQNQLLYNQTC